MDTSSIALLSALPQTLTFCLILLVGHWAYRHAGLFSGYWLCAFTVVTAVTAVLSPMITRQLIDGLMQSASARAVDRGIPLSMAFTAVRALGKVPLVLLILSEVVTVIAARFEAERLPAAIGWLSRLYRYRLVLGLTAVALPIFGLAAHYLVAQIMLAGLHDEMLGPYDELSP